MDNELQQALSAWVHFKQYLHSGEGSVLAQVKECLKSDPNGSPKSKRTSKTGAADSAAQAVYQAMQEHLFSSLQDFFHEYSSPEQLTGVLDVAMFVAEGMGQNIHETLEGFIDTSLEKNLSRLWIHASEEVETEKGDDDEEDGDDEESVAATLAVFAASVQVPCDLQTFKRFATLTDLLLC